MPNNLDLLPEPPQEKSVQFLCDQICYFQGKTLRDTPRGELVVSDARVSSENLFRAFSEAFGIEITKEKTPEIREKYFEIRVKNSSTFQSKSISSQNICFKVFSI